jgi:prevent-host-death family protein
MTYYDHIIVMKAIHIADLKAHLSAYLRLVRRGHTLIIADRQTPIARMVPFQEKAPLDLGVVEARKPAGSILQVKSVTPAKDFDPLDALLEERSRG